MPINCHNISTQIFCHFFDTLLQIWTGKTGSFVRSISYHNLFKFKAILLFEIPALYMCVSVCVCACVCGGWNSWVIRKLIFGSRTYKHTHTHTHSLSLSHTHIHTHTHTHSHTHSHTLTHTRITIESFIHQHRHTTHPPLFKAIKKWAPFQFSHFLSFSIKWGP